MQFILNVQSITSIIVFELTAKLKLLASSYWYYEHTVSAYHKTKDQILEEYDVILSAQKNPKNFAPIYTKYYDEIFLFINKRVDHLEVTADLTSKVFLNCLKNIKKYKYQGVPFSAWLYKIALNEVNMFFRQQNKMERTVNIDDQDINQLMIEIDSSEEKIDPHVLIPVLLEQLNDREVQFIELRFFEGKSFKEMGYLLGLTEVNAKVKTYRIIKKLKELSAQVKYN